MPETNSPGRRKGMRLLSAALLMISTALIGVGVGVMTAPSASATTIGPGSSASIPGFIGYLTNGNMELGVGILPNGKMGLCIDTGAEHPWPDGALTEQSIANDEVNYAIDVWYEKIRKNNDEGQGVRAAKQAAALWWAVGLELGGGLNSQKGAMQTRIDTMQSERPAVYDEVRDIKNTIVADARRLSGPYTARIAVGDAGGGKAHAVDLGVTNDRGNWIGGYNATLTATNATFDATGTATMPLTTAETPQGTLLTPVDISAPVSVQIEVRNLPGNRYYLYRDADNAAAQRVPTRGDTVDRTAAAAGTVTRPVVYVPLRVTKSATNGDPAGVVGVGIEVREGSVSGPVIDRHTFTAGDVNGAGQGTVVFADNYDTNGTYFVVIVSEPRGWKPTEPVVQAAFNGTTEFAAVLSDEKVFEPRFRTQVSDQSANVGDLIFDTVTVLGAADGEEVIGQWRLLGPVTGGDVCPAQDDPTWDAAEVEASGDFRFDSDGDYRVGEHRVTEPGCYTYVESAAGSSHNYPIAETPKGEPSETTIVKHTPSLVTQISTQTATIGATLTDTVTVSGTGGAQVQGEWRLIGPVAASTEGACPPEGDAGWSTAPTADSGSFTANGDGAITGVGEHKVDAAGCYTYQERLLESPTTWESAWHAPGIVAETALVKSLPVLVTQISDQAVEVGATITDTVTVSGTNGASVAGEWRLLGPIASTNAACPAEAAPEWAEAKVVAEGTFSIVGDGEVTDLGEHEVTEVGCFTYQERLLESPTTAAFDWHPAGMVAETVLVSDAAVDDPRVPKDPKVPAGAGDAGTASWSSPLAWGGAAAIAALTGLGLALLRRRRLA